MSEPKSTETKLETKPETTVTAPTTTRVKDPRRVAQGKMLAEITRRRGGKDIHNP